MPSIYHACICIIPYFMQNDNRNFTQNYEHSANICGSRRGYSERDIGRVSVEKVISLQKAIYLYSFFLRWKAFWLYFKIEIYLRYNLSFFHRDRKVLLRVTVIFLSRLSLKSPALSEWELHTWQTHALRALSSLLKPELYFICICLWIHVKLVLSVVAPENAIVFWAHSRFARFHGYMMYKTFVQI